MLSPSPLTVGLPDPRAPAVRPGESLLLRLPLQNHGAVPLLLRLHVEGIPATWAANVPAEQWLPPGTSVLRLPLTIPLAPDSRAGTFALTVRLSAPAQPAWRAHCRAALTVRPLDALALTLEPVGQGGSWLSPRAHFHLQVENRGNRPRDLSLHADAPGAVYFAASSAPRTALRLAPGEQCTLPLQVALPRPLVARAPLLATVRVRNEEGAEEARATLALAPLLGQPLLAILGVLAAGFLFAVAGLLLRPATPERLPDPTQWGRGDEVWLPTLADDAPHRVSPGSPPEPPATGAAIVAAPQQPALVEQPVSEAAVRALVEGVATPPPAPPATPSTPPAGEQPAAAESLPILVAPRAADPLLSRASDEPERYEALVREVALQQEVDWRLLAAIAYHESRFKPDARGQAGEQGLMQIMPATWAGIAPAVNMLDPWDPYANLMAGAYFLRAMQQQFAARGHPEWYWALAAYNWGPTRLDALLDRGGQWSDVPVEVQWYAYRILQDVAEQAAPWWQDELQRVAYPE